VTRARGDFSPVCSHSHLLLVQLHLHVDLISVDQRSIVYNEEQQGRKPSLGAAKQLTGGMDTGVVGGVGDAGQARFCQN